MRVTPFHGENYSRLILGVIIQFYTRCSDRYQNLTTRDAGPSAAPETLTAAVWAQTSDIVTCLSTLRASSVSELECECV